MYPSFEGLRQNKQRVVFSEDFSRLYWPLRGTFPTALSVMKTMRGALQEMEPLQHEDGSWHEIASIPLTEPKVSSINAFIPLLDDYEGNWVAWHEHHEAAEYVKNSNLGARHEYPFETDPAMGYLVKCCGQDRPEYKDSLTIQYIRGY
ncbi:LysM domain-containing protein [Cordyceps javanica]|uniref:LysM domain-containing protein n=1 Tax=Cordyceps javanica TaxID=43265 RepID=A0A545VIL3_9HYPO|nr:LysM domain-containing protein [Cordyceps javanica]TQW01573.1 LysM domain containing protein [Cordyceps javanica]